MCFRPFWISLSLIREVDELIGLLYSDPLWTVGIWFADFAATSDEEVCL